MTDTFSDSHSSRLVDAIRHAISSKNAFDPEPYFGIPLADELGRPAIHDGSQLMTAAGGN